MCDDITCEYLNLASVARMDDITYDDLTCDDRDPDLSENLVLGLMT